MENYGFQTHYMNSAYPIYGSGTNDTHGGHARLHKDMMVEIANEIFDKKFEMYISKIEEDAYTRAYTQFVEDLSFDVDTAVSFAFNDAREILLDHKTRNVIATHIMDEIKKQMRGRLM